MKQEESWLCCRRRNCDVTVRRTIRQGCLFYKRRESNGSHLEHDIRGMNKMGF